MTKPNDPVSGQFHGLTKREYFAAMAMQGILANNYENHEDYVFAVQEAIEYADELICQLNVKQFDSEYADYLIEKLNKTSNEPRD